jgi:hypothetical protein
MPRQWPKWAQSRRRYGGGKDRFGDQIFRSGRIRPGWSGWISIGPLSGRGAQQANIGLRGGSGWKRTIPWLPHRSVVCQEGT